MADDIKSLDDLKAAVSAAAPAAVEAAPRAPQRDKLGRSYATGKRKDAVARVWIKPGSGKVIVNGKEINGLLRPSRAADDPASQPFQRGRCLEGQFDVNATVAGGGLSGQAGAVKHGISKALQLYEPALRGALKAAGFLTRDSRVVERKKYGKAKAAAASSSRSADRNTLWKTRVLRARVFFWVASVQKNGRAQGPAEEEATALGKRSPNLNPPEPAGDFVGGAQGIQADVAQHMRVKARQIAARTGSGAPDLTSATKPANAPVTLVARRWGRVVALLFRPMDHLLY